MKLRITMLARCMALCLAAVAADGRADLRGSIKSGNLGEVQEYLSAEKSRIDARLTGGATPLQEAIDAGQQEVAKLLIRNGANIHVLNEDGSTLLHRAVKLDQKEVVAMLLKHGAKVDALWGSATPLELAALSGSVEVGELLIAHGAKVDYVEVNSPFSPSPSTMTLAIESNHPDFVRLLLAKGANCTLKDESGDSYLHRSGAEFVDIFVSCGVDVNGMNGLGETPLHRAGSVKQAERLIALGANVNARDKSGRTPLMAKAPYHHLGEGMFRLLVEHGADVNARDNEGMTLMHFLASDPDIVKLAIDKGADVNARANPGPGWGGESGFTPLHAVAANGKPEVGRLLLAKGANIDAATDTTLYTPLVIAILKKNTDVARMLIENGANVNALAEREQTPLKFAIEQKNTDVALLLIANGADVTASGGSRDTPLFQAVHAGNTPVVAALIKKGVDVKSVDAVDATALHYAAMDGNKELAELLLAKGAGVQAKDKNGMTPLHGAVKEGRRELVQLLVAKGADVNATDNRGVTPIRIASPDIARLLAAMGGRQLAISDAARDNRACKSVVDHANAGTLAKLASADRRAHGPQLGISDVATFEDVNTVDGLRTLNIDGAAYVLGESGDRLVYLSKPWVNGTEQLVCMFGRRERTDRDAGVRVDYFVITRAEVELSHLRQQSDSGSEAKPIPLSVPRSLVDGAEIHVIAGYRAGTKDAIETAEPGKSIVRVNRPGKKVLLVLVSLRPVLWHVGVSQDTKLQGILYSYQPNEGNAEPAVTSDATTGIYRVSLSYVPSVQDQYFAQLLRQLHSWAGVNKVDSLYVSYFLPPTVDVSKPGTPDPLLTVDYPPVERAPVGMDFYLYDRRLRPVKWSLTGVRTENARGTEYLSGGNFAVAPNGKDVYMSGNLAQLVRVDMDTGASHHFEALSECDVSSFSSGFAYDSRRDIVSVIARDGFEGGRLCQFDPKTEHWLGHHSLGYSDVLSLAYDKTTDQYLALTSHGDLLYISANGEQIGERFIADKLPGYYQLYGIGDLREHSIVIEPHGKDVALVGFKDGKVARVWYYNADKGNALLTYKAG